MNSRDEHVVDRMADYLLGRLDPAEHAAVQEHLASCAECREDAEFATRLRDSAARHAHVDPERLVAIADGSADASTQEAEHLSTCKPCTEELETLIAIPSPDAAAPPRAVRTSPRMRVRRTGLAVLVAAAAMVVFLLVPRGGVEDVTGLATIEQLPVRITRSGETDEFTTARVRGLEAYRDGDYATATEALGAALRIRPDHVESLLYLASAHLLRDEDADARYRLERAMNAPEATEGELIEVRWLMAQIALRANDPGSARQILLPLRNAPRRGEDVRRVLEALD